MIETPVCCYSGECDGEGSRHTGSVDPHTGSVTPGSAIHKLLDQTTHELSMLLKHQTLKEVAGNEAAETESERTEMSY